MFEDLDRLMHANRPHAVEFDRNFPVKKSGSRPEKKDIEVKQRKEEKRVRRFRPGPKTLLGLKHVIRLHAVKPG
jgi:hypothetical protein